MTRRRSPFHLTGIAVLVFAVACGSGPETEGSGGTEPGTRTISVQALDTLKFDPAAVTVSVGETVRFVVTNQGAGHHEFVLGDEEVQEMHQEGMDDGHHGGGAEPLAALELKPGETKESAVTFDQPGQILYGCHVEGHYQAGMAGTVTVE